ncbi:IucA/IucC family C-terminal-domain containing protein [Paenibacillus sp. CAU 1782]
MAATNSPFFLTPKEWEEMPSRFAMNAEEVDKPLLSSILAFELLDKEKCARYLDWLGAHIGAPSRRVTASMLAKRYAYLVVSPVLHAMTMYNKGLGLSLGNCRLIAPDYSGCLPERSKFPELLFDGPPLMMSVPAAGGRTSWRDGILRELFAGHLSPLFRSLAEAGGVPQAILWENTAVRIAPVYEDVLSIETARNDYNYIIQDAAAELFGQRRNPLSPFLEPAAPRAAFLAERVRKTCCLYYEMAPEYCRKCPKA